MTDGQCQIRYRMSDGVVHEWGIGCDADEDTEASIEAHLLKWYPRAEFLGCCITRVKDGVVVMDSRVEVAPSGMACSGATMPEKSVAAIMAARPSATPRPRPGSRSCRGSVRTTGRPP